MTAQIPKTPLPPEDHDQESDAITKLGNQPVQEACCRCAASSASASSEKPIACIDRRGLLNSVARMWFFSGQNQPRSGIAGKPNLT